MWRIIILNVKYNEFVQQVCHLPTIIISVIIIIIIITTNDGDDIDGDGSGGSSIKFNCLNSQ